MTPQSAPARARQRAALRVYIADTRDLSASDIATHVTDDDRAKLGAYAHSRRKAQYLAGRALLRFSLEQTTSLPARSHRLTTRPGGKIECAGGPAISLAHSGTLVVCMVGASGDVGIDVQLTDAWRHTDEISRHYLSATEREWLRAAPRDAFYLLWVLKEAYLKCVGSGLSGGLGSLECRVEPPMIAIRAAVPAQVAAYTAGEAYIGIASTGATLPEVRIERWLPSQVHTHELPIRFVAATAAVPPFASSQVFGCAAPSQSSHASSHAGRVSPELAHRETCRVAPIRR